MATIHKLGTGKSEVHMQCAFCGKTFSVEVPTEGYNKWQAGTSIQKAMPDVSADDREMLITQVCTQCIDATYDSFMEESDPYYDGVKDGDL